MEDVETAASERHVIMLVGVREASGDEPPLAEGARAGVRAPDEGAFEGGGALLSPLSPNPNKNATNSACSAH